MVSSLPRKSIWVRIAIAATAAVAVVLILILAAGKTDATEPPAPSTQFSVLEPVTPDAIEALPTGARVWVEKFGTSFYAGAEAGEIGLAELPSGDVAIAAAGTSICWLDLASQGGNCGDVEQVAAGRIFVATPVSCGSFRVTGVMPDGVSSLSVETGDEVGQIVPVISNVYSETFETVPTTLVSDGGNIEVQLPLAFYGQENDGCDPEG